MASEAQQLSAAIEALQAQRGLLGDAVVDAALGPMQTRLALLLTQQAAAPEAPGAAAQSLRLVSIVFADMVGSTQLAARLDAEDMLELFSNALAGLATVVQAHGGRVMRFTGDGLKAVFGADQAQEDDPERAVRCGLALLAAAAAHRQHLRLQRHDAVDLDFQIRVGIHTGPVALGGGIEGADTAIGSAVHIAARMEQAGPPGALRISHDTYRHVHAMFEVQAQAPLQVKGVAEPMATYLVQRALPRMPFATTRGVAGVPTRMVGRDAELLVLQHAFVQLFSTRSLAAVTVVGEAGVGKSRLLHEFQAWLAGRPERFQAFFGRATPQTQGQPFGLLRDVLAWRFQIADDDSVDAARGKLEQGLLPLFLHDDGADFAQAHAHLLAHLIGIDSRHSRHLQGILDDPLQIRSRALHAAAQVFRRAGAADGSPVVLQLEDLHWADNDSLDFLHQLTTRHRDQPLLMLAFTRATLFERRPDWRSTEGRHQSVDQPVDQRVDLAPLDPAGSRQLADQLLARLADAPPTLHELLTTGAEGNPFYMEELVKMLIDQGAIRTGGAAPDVWQLDPARLQATEVPATLTGVLQARLDGLPAAERLSLQQASVIGPVFWERALAALDEHALLTLPALVRRALAVPRAASTGAPDDDGQHGYAFQHHILHQVTYATVLKRSRRVLHGRLANWLAQQTGHRADQQLGITAEHYAQAGDEKAAAEFHARAAAHARSRFAHETALHHVQSALALLAGAPDTADLLALRWRLLDTRERTLDVQGERAGQQAHIGALEQLAEALHDDGRRAHAAYRRGILALRTADWPACEQAGRRAMALAGQAGDNGVRLLAMRLVALALAKRGDLDAAQPLVHSALLQARDAGLRAVESLCLNALAVMASMRSDAIGVLNYATLDLAVNRDTGNRRGEAISLSTVGCGWMDLGEHTRAAHELEASLRLLRANGDRVIEVATLSCLSTVALRQGDAARALVLAQTAVETAAAVQAHDMQAIALSKLGNARYALGQLDAAARAYRQCHALALGLDEPVQHDALAGLARVALAQRQPGQALQLLEGLLVQGATAGALDGAEEPRLIELTVHQVLLALGDPRAGDWLLRAHGELQATAAHIHDAALRQGFLEHIPAHHEIEAAWAARPASDGHSQEAGRGRQ